MSSKKTKNQKDSSRDSEKSHSVDSISVGKKSIGNKIGDFWRQYILRKKGSEKTRQKDKDKDSTSSADVPMTPEEKAQLAAELATNALGDMDKKSKDQIRKALAADMHRRHRERERRRKELMTQTEVSLPWGRKPKQASSPSVGAAVYPIKMARTSSPPRMPAVAVSTGRQSQARASSVDADLSAEDPEWKPVAAATTATPSPSESPLQSTAPSASPGPTLEEKRRSWMEKSAKGRPLTARSPEGMRSFPKKSSMLAGPPASPSTVSPSWSQSDNQQQLAGPPEAYGSQPTAIQMDEDTVREIHAHTVGQMLQNLLKEAAAQQSTSKKTPPKRAAVSKEPQHMTPDELIEFRNRDPRQWDRFTRQNTIYSYGVSTPTSEDVEQGQKLSQKKRANKVTFDTEIDVVRAPAGRDFQFNEKTDRSTSILRK